jgi:hypothetical protein
MLKKRIFSFIQKNGFLFNSHKPSNKPNILLYAIPRSGSTWLMELIWTQPKFKPINEPLDFRFKINSKKSGISGFQELYSVNVKEKLVAYFKGFVDGKYHFKNPNPLRKNFRFFTSRIVFKVIHGGEVFINDIAEHTNSKIVYLIRNPIAVALSRKQLPRINELTSDFVLLRFTPQEREYAKQIMRDGTDMEKRIMAWCIQNKLALQHKTEDWLVISYEDLTCNPKKVLSDLVNYCDLQNLDLMLNSVNIPSAVTSQSENDSITLMQQNDQIRMKLIRKWRDKINTQEMKNYFTICKKMNFELYSESNDFPKL